MNLYGIADLHLHTTASDGTATVPQVLERVAVSGLDVVAITDHDTLDGALEARRLARDYGVEVVVGEEVSTADGHLIGLFMEEFVPPGRPAVDTIAAIRAQGGLCVAPHPYDWAVRALGQTGLRTHCAGPRAGFWQLDAIEVFNASLSWPRGGCNRMAERVARELGMPMVGGSDAHSLATIGRGYTRFAGRSADDLYRALQAGNVSWGGECWSLAHYLDVSWMSVRQRNVWGAIKLACCELPLVRRLPM